MKNLIYIILCALFISCSKTHDYNDYESQHIIFKQAFGVDLPQKIDDLQLAIKDGDNSETVWMKFLNKDSIVQKLLKKDSLSKETQKQESALIYKKVLYTLFNGYEDFKDSAIVGTFKRYSIDTVKTNAYIKAIHQIKKSKMVYAGFFKLSDRKELTEFNKDQIPKSDNYTDEPINRERFSKDFPKWINFDNWFFTESDFDIYFKPYYKSLLGKYTLSGFTYLYVNRKTNEIYYFASGNDVNTR